MAERILGAMRGVAARLPLPLPAALSPRPMTLDLTLPPSGRRTPVAVAQNGQAVAEVALNSPHEATAFSVGGVAYRVEKSRADGALVLLDAATGLPEAQAVRLGGFASDRAVEAALPGGAVLRFRFALVAGAPEIELRTAEGVVGRFRRNRTARRLVQGVVPDAWPLPLAVFLGWLAARYLAAE